MMIFYLPPIILSCTISFASISTLIISIPTRFDIGQNQFLLNLSNLFKLNPIGTNLFPFGIRLDRFQTRFGLNLWRSEYFKLRWRGRSQEGISWVGLVKIDGFVLRIFLFIVYWRIFYGTLMKGWNAYNLGLDIIINC